MTIQPHNHTTVQPYNRKTVQPQTVYFRNTAQTLLKINNTFLSF